MKKILRSAYILCYIPLHATEMNIQKAYDSLINDDYDTALVAYQELAKTHPHNGDILCSIGFILKKQQKMQEAITAYEKARPFVDRTSKIERALSSAYLALGDFEKGWAAYEYRWINPPAYNQELKNYLNAGNSLKNKIVLLKTEYGLGDTLQFIRYAKILKDKGAHIIVECQKPLIPLLKQCPYIDEIVPEGRPTPYHFMALLMSLPLIFDTTRVTIPTQIPYLYADQTVAAYWQEKLGQDTHIKIGICWQADIHKDSPDEIVKKDSQAKSIPLNYLTQLAELPNIKLYSLQKVNGLDQLTALPRTNKIHHFDALDKEHGPFMDTAALMQQLDLIITVDTSIAHLAGGLGVPVWVVLPYAADWRWMLDRNDSPWYPTMRLFKQSQPGNWQSVINQMIQGLK
ncbi:MAG: hypothetical protein NTX86_03140 [Candidatus Dependentiae bacterium]|nr:hypothetical protein [Candidatus Dependentiae bacterium]